MNTDGSIGLRERKKAQTRAALRATALRRFGEFGFDQVTVADIAAENGVSERTFFRYYASKEDVLLVDLMDLLPALLDALRARPAAEHPLMAMYHALVSVVPAGGPPALGLALGEPVDRGSMALPRLLKVFSVWEQGLTDALVVRFGAPDGIAPAALRRRASVTACAGMSAIRSSLQTYRAAHPHGDGSQAELAELLHEAFALLTDGCPAP